MPEVERRPGAAPYKPRTLKSKVARMKEYQLFIVTILLLGSVMLGFCGFSAHNGFAKVDETFLDILYRSLQLISMNSGAVTPPVPWQLQVARFLAPAVATYAVLLALFAIFNTQIGRIRLRFMKDHVVICGLGRKGLHLARSFHDAGNRVVVIEKSAQNDNLSFCQDRGIATIIGDAQDPMILDRASIHRAKHVFVVCDSDGVNAQTAIQAQEHLAGRAAPTVTCHVHIINLALCRLLREKQVRERYIDSFRLEFFNVFEAGARAMLDSYAGALSRQARRGSPPMLVVFGLGRLGESLIIRAIRDWRQNESAADDKLRIIVYDRNASSKITSLNNKYPQLDKYCDLVSREVEIKPQEFRSGAAVGLDTMEQPSTVFICLDDEGTGFALGLALHYWFRARRYEAPIVVRTEESAGLARILSTRGQQSDDIGKLSAFGLIDFTCNKEIVKHGVAEKLARSIHETYVLRQKQKGETVETNPSLMPWEELDSDLRDLNFAQADHFVERLAALDCSIILLSDWDAEDFTFTSDEVETMAKIEHKRWCEYMTSRGWTEAPGEKDKIKNTHPDLVSWENLSEAARKKDRETVVDLPVFLARVGFQVTEIKKNN